MSGWNEVAAATKDAKCIAWDGCHKIYLGMDDEQVELFRTLGYGDDDGSNLITADKADPGQMLYWLERWYENSCGLKFVSAVRTNKKDPNAGFSTLIPQGWEDDE